MRPAPARWGNLGRFVFAHALHMEILEVFWGGQGRWGKMFVVVFVFS